MYEQPWKVSDMRNSRGVLLLCVTASAMTTPRPWSQPVEKDPQAPESVRMNPLFVPEPSVVEAATRIGQQAVKRKMTSEGLLKRWSARVPEANGYAVALVLPVLVAAAAYDAEKFHKDEATRQKQIAAAVERGREHLSFLVVLRSKGTGSWLWPRGMKPGDRQALEAIKFVLADDQGHFFQPLDPEAQKRINAESKELGLPFGISTYIPLGSFYLSLPFSLGGTRQDFEARYEPTFALRDEKGNPVLTDATKGFSLRIIGNTDEKAVEFKIEQLLEKSKQF